MENYTPFHVVKFKQTYQTTKSTSPQELRNANCTLRQVIANDIQLNATIETYSTSSADVSRQHVMSVIHILFQNRKRKITTVSQLISIQKIIIIELLN